MEVRKMNRKITFLVVALIATIMPAVAIADDDMLRYRPMNVAGAAGLLRAKLRSITLIISM